MALDEGPDLASLYNKNDNVRVEGVEAGKMGDIMGVIGGGFQDAEVQSSGGTLGAGSEGSAQKDDLTMQSRAQPGSTVNPSTSGAPSGVTTTTSARPSVPIPSAKTKAISARLLPSAASKAAASSSVSAGAANASTKTKSSSSTDPPMSAAPSSRVLASSAAMSSVSAKALRTLPSATSSSSTSSSLRSIVPSPRWEMNAAPPESVPPAVAASSAPPVDQPISYEQFLALPPELCTERVRAYGRPPRQTPRMATTGGLPPRKRLLKVEDDLGEEGRSRWKEMREDRDRMLKERALVGSGASDEEMVNRRGSREVVPRVECRVLGPRLDRPAVEEEEEEENMRGGRGSRSSPIDIESSPISSSPVRNASPALVRSTPTRQPSPAQSQASSVSPRRNRFVTPHPSSPSEASYPLRPTRVQPSSPIAVSRAASESASVMLTREEGEEGGLGQVRGMSVSKRAAGKRKATEMENECSSDERNRAVSQKMAGRSGREESGGRLKRKKRNMSPASTSSADEISTQLEAVAPSSPSRPLPRKGRKTALRMSHVEIPVRRSSRRARKESAQSAVLKEPSPPIAGHSSSVASSGIQFLLEIPEKAPDYVRRVLEQGARVCEGDGSERYRALVAAWLEFERRERYLGSQNLSADGHPPQVGAWIAVARRAAFKPRIEDVEKFIGMLNRWWWHCAPEWRRGREDSLELRKGTGDWSCIALAGQNRLASIVTAVGWGLKGVQELPRRHYREKQHFEKVRGQWEAIVEDLVYTFGELEWV
ncbi:hypothetical protein V5O48_013546 [Marasmius crinis-equi]|uniref:Uncharacterized protein n=1 Tax=Marasmius crinis-equi TaxID=585013 RepID=A0ABR3EZS5_9AGAR